MKKKSGLIGVTDYFLWILFGLCLIYWIYDSATKVFLVIRQDSIVGLFSPDKFESTIHIFVALTILVLGIIVQTAIIRSKKVEERLRKSEKRFRELADLLPQPIYEMDTEGKLVFLSRMGFELAGLDSDRVKQGLSAFELIVNEDHERLKSNMKRMLGGENFGGEQYRILRNDGSFFPVEVFSTVVKDDDEPVGLRGVIIDITDRKKAEEQLKDSEERLRDFLDNANDLIQIVDPQGHYTYVNRKWRQVLGYSSEEVENLQADEIITADSRDNSQDILGTLYRGKSIDSIEVDFRTKSGQVITVEGSINCRMENGKPVNTRGIFRDITERKRADEALRRAKEETEVANRELEKLIEKANQLAVEAEVANAAKSEFLANMSHEIRTPMNGVVGMTGLLLETELTAEQRDFAETIRSSADALLTIINDILDFSKIESGKLELDYIEFDIRVTLEDISDVMAIKAHEKDLELITSVEADVPPVLKGDPGRIRQVLINLIGNAVKFTSEGEVSVRIGVKQDNDENTLLLFEVRDTGIGIPPEKVRAVFESFTQADTSTTRRFGGTGLGLAISKRLTEIMDGEIGVESEIGKGSVFWFTARLDKGDASQIGEAKMLEDISDHRILIVDDNETNRFVLTELLRSWGCIYHEAPGGEYALEILRDGIIRGKPIEVAILDMVMPGMDGEMLGRKIKEDPELKDTLLVMLTSLQRRGDAALYEEIGFSAYLTKPVKQSHLHDCLAMLLSHSSAIEAKPSKKLITRHTIAEGKRRKIRILVAEDNPTNQKVALKVLEKLGYNAEVVSNGIEALEILKNRDYDLILMDVQMPEMDGLEATQEIRNQATDVRNHEIPIVAMTAHAMKEDRDRCLDAGMDDYVSKPIQPKALSSIVEKWTGQSMEKQKSASAEGSDEKRDRVVFDREGLMDRLGDDDEMMREILEVYLDDMPVQIKQLRESLHNQNSECVRRDAHSIKGASGNVGAVLIQETARHLEMACESDNLSQADMLVSKIIDEFSRFKKHLSENGIIN